jgi:hypothetical protein
MRLLSGPNPADPDVQPAMPRGTLPTHPQRRHARRNGWKVERVHDERGDIISGWLMQLLLFMAVVGLFGYELLSIAITTLTLDGDVEQVADAAADAYERSDSLDTALEAAQAEAAKRNTVVVDLVVDEQARVVVVTVVKETPTLLIHRIPGLEGTKDVAATRRSGYGL